jgi:hypothetical protein
MDDRCRCGEVLNAAYEAWRCRACGAACCPACADAEGGAPRCLPCGLTSTVAPGEAA